MFDEGRGMHTLPRPTHLLRGIYTRLRRAEPEPHRATPVPGLDICTRGHFGKIVLRGAGMVHLLRRDVVDGRACWDGHDVGGIARLIAPDVARSRILDALFGVCIFCHASGGPVLFFGFAVDDEAGKGICLA